ncbi:MAG: DUF45 domain-containing protein [Frankiales bacterium]|nr:DUF45 domain-containing protein [Frankiales bacterium]
MSQTVVDLPGLPPDVEVRRSTRRRRSVTAYREGGRTIVVVPQRMARADIPAYVEELVERLRSRERRVRGSDAELMRRAEDLSRRHLEGRAVPRSVRWVGNQNRRWGSCTPADAAIRLSDRLAAMPEHVVDYVLLHELVHLLVPGHGPQFEAWMTRYPRLLEARAFLAGVDHATSHGLDLAETPDGEPEAADPAAERPVQVADGAPTVGAGPAAAPEPAAALRRRRPAADSSGGAEPLF